MYRTSAGTLICALFLVLTGAIFVATTLVPGEPASLRYFFAPASALLVVIAPAVSMRTFSEEARAGTIETLLTAPAQDWAIVLGKYLGSCLFLASVFAPTLVFPAALWWAADAPPDPGPIVTGYLGLLLVGSTYLALGVLVSSLTESQTLAFLAAFLVLIGYLVATGPLAPRLPAPLDAFAANASIQVIVSDFAKGVIDTGSVLTLLGVQGSFVGLAWASLDSRRWR
jgi:ABC-2 type transport system permease protein